MSDLKITPFLVPSLSQPVRVGIVQFNVVHDRRDDALDPHKGIYNTLDLGLADRIFGSQRNFLRFLARNATYHQVSEAPGVGAQHAIRRHLRVPIQRRSRRMPSRWPSDSSAAAERRTADFPENQAGPRDTSTGFPLGGTALLFNQTELRFPLIGENIGGVLYHDMGNVYSSVENLSFRVKQRGPGRFRLHGARGRLRPALPHPDRPGPRRSWDTASIRHTSSASKERRSNWSRRV